MGDHLAVRIYRLLLKLYPAAFRQRLGEEMATVFAEAVAEAGAEGGPALVRVIGRELLYFPGSLLLAYGQSWRQLRPAAVAAPGWPWIAGWTLLSVGMLPVAWLLMAPFGVFFLFLVELLPGAAPALAVSSVLGFTTAVGGVTGLVQWLLLRRHLPGAGWWVPLTVGGWIGAGLLIFVTITLAGDVRMLSPALVFLLAGASLGVSQALLLRRLVPGGGWWLPVSLLAAASLFVAGEAGEAIGSITEMVLLIMLPYLLTGAFLWLLLQRAAQKFPAVGEGGLRRRPLSGTGGVGQGRRLYFLALLLLATFLVVGPWAYAAAQLELAKREGVYASPEEAIRMRATAEGGQVEKIEMVVDTADPDLPHVRWAGAYIVYDRPPAYTDRHTLSTGSYYIRVEGGWVHLGEGAFPTLVGRLMEVYHLEGVGD